MAINHLLSQMDEMVSRGRIVEAVDAFFSDEACTHDFDGFVTRSKSEMLDKMIGFVGSIQQVNDIRLHRSLVAGDVSMSEYTFDFAMQDGSRVLWHEIIRRQWRDGKVVDEQYFKN